MKYKVKLVLVFIALSFYSVAQLPTPKITIFNVHLDGLIVGAENASIYLYNQNIKQGKQPHHTISTNDKGEFSADISIPFQDYYYLRLENGQGLNLVLSGNDSVTIYGDTKDILATSNIIGSEPSANMQDFYKNYLPFKSFEDSLKAVLKQDDSKQNEVNEAFQKRASLFYGYRNNYINQNTNSPALLAALVAINKEGEFDLYKQIIQRVIEVFPGSQTSATLARNLEQEVLRKEATAKLAPGKIAPDIAIPNKDGKIIKLSDLKGKVVLIDFWASWCGPCRRENPNVVSAYNKYNKDGFEVFSVSFDKPGMKDRWLAAIEKDGLIWPNHGSELTGFNNQAARDYAVKGIPFTCLVDREGKIIATNLRGAALLQQLKAIFGY